MLYERDLSMREEVNEFREGLYGQSSVFLALVFKEFMSRIRSSRLGLLFSFLTPMVFVSVIGFMYYLMGRTTIQGTHVLLFIPTGIAVFLIIRLSLFGGLSRAMSKGSALFDYPRVKPIDAVIAAYVLNISILTVAIGILLFLLWWFFGLTPPMPKPMEAMAMMFMTIIGAFGMNLFISVYSTFYPAIKRTVRLMRRPVVFLCGVLHPVSPLPPGARAILAWNPVVHIVEYMRWAVLGIPPFPEFSLIYPIVTVTIVVGVAMLAYYANRYELLRL